MLDKQLKRDPFGQKYDSIDKSVDEHVRAVVIDLESQRKSHFLWGDLNCATASASECKDISKLTGQCAPTKQSTCASTVETGQAMRKFLGLAPAEKQKFMSALQQLVMRHASVLFWLEPFAFLKETHSHSQGMTFEELVKSHIAPHDSLGLKSEQNVAPLMHETRQKHWFPNQPKARADANAYRQKQPEPVYDTDKDVNKARVWVMDQLDRKQSECRVLLERNRDQVKKFALVLSRAAFESDLEVARQSRTLDESFVMDMHHKASVAVLRHIDDMHATAFVKLEIVMSQVTDQVFEPTQSHGILAMYRTVVEELMKAGLDKVVTKPVTDKDLIELFFDVAPWQTEQNIASALTMYRERYPAVTFDIAPFIWRKHDVDTVSLYTDNRAGINAVFNKLVQGNVDRPNLKEKQQQEETAEISHRGQSTTVVDDVQNEDNYDISQ